LEVKNMENVSITKPNAEAKDIDELFSGKVFKVPDYQRLYSWEKENWEDFWNDIKEGLETKTIHYWGTITLRATNEIKYCGETETYFNVYEVVDGQQRLTTIYLFILALSNAGKEALKKKYIKCGDVYRLELGGPNKEFLKDLVDGNNPEPDIRSNKQLQECLEYFKNQIKEFVKMGGNIDELSRYLQKITFSLEFVVQDEMLAIKAFESLNDRGKPLTLLDKTKSYLMFISARYLNNTLNNRIQEIFGRIFLNYDIIKEIGEKEEIDYIKSGRFKEDELLRFFYHYFSYYAIEKYRLYDLPNKSIAYNYDITVEGVFDSFLKDSCNSLKNNNEVLEEFALDFLENFDKFISSFKRLIKKVSFDCKYRKLFSFLGLNTRVYPLIISLETEGILDAELLNLIEVLDLRVYKIRGTDPRASLYKDVITKIKENPNPERIKKGIREFIKQFMPDPEFQHYLSGSLYKNPGTKYILWEYEKSLEPETDECDAELFRKCQVEHVLPQKPTFAFPGYGFESEEEYVSYINKLGNLCLLEETLNKKCQNKVPEQKREYYEQSQIPRTKNLAYKIGLSGFKKDDIEQTTKDIIEFCLKRWPIL